MLSIDIIYAAINKFPISIMKLNAIDGSILVKKILYYGTILDTYSRDINFLGYAPNA